MDAIKNAVNKATSGSHGTTGAPAGGAAPGAAPGAAGKEDYGDKGIDAMEKKFGQDPNKLRSVNEKVSDSARGMFEKSSGKKVPEKFSN